MVNALNTTTLKLADIEDILAWSIKHRCLDYWYTKSVSHIGQCRYKPKSDGPPSIEHRCLDYQYTKNVWYALNLP